MIIFVYQKYLCIKIDSPADDILVKLFLTLELSKVIRYINLISGFLGLPRLVNVLLKSYLCVCVCLYVRQINQLKLQAG